MHGRCCIVRKVIGTTQDLLSDPMLSIINYSGDENWVTGFICDEPSTFRCFCLSGRDEREEIHFSSPLSIPWNNLGICMSSSCPHWHTAWPHPYTSQPHIAPSPDQIFPVTYTFKNICSISIHI